MKLVKAVNRTYQGKTYYRWIVSVPPKDIRALGWVSGQQLEAIVQGRSLTIHPSSHPKAGRRYPSANPASQAVRLRTFGRPGPIDPE